MLNSILLYIGDIQREGRFMTSRIRMKVILNLLAVFFLIIAVIATLIGGCIYLADAIGAGPAALTVAGGALILALIFYIWMSILNRSTRRASLRIASPVAAPIAAVTATQLATQAAIATTVKKHPYMTLLASVAFGYIATRSSITKK